VQPIAGDLWVGGGISSGGEFHSAAEVEGTQADSELRCRCERYGGLDGPDPVYVIAQGYYHRLARPKRKGLPVGWLREGLAIPVNGSGWRDLSKVQVGDMPRLGMPISSFGKNKDDVGADNDPVRPVEEMYGEIVNPIVACLERCNRVNLPRVGGETTRLHLNVPKRDLDYHHRIVLVRYGKLDCSTCLSEADCGEDQAGCGESLRAEPQSHQASWP
jgi:hypothetical protein